MRKHLKAAFERIAEGAPTGHDVLEILRSTLGARALRQDDYWVCEAYRSEADELVAGWDDDDGEVHELVSGLSDELWVVELGYRLHPLEEEPDGWSLVLAFEEGEEGWTSERIQEEGTFAAFLEVITDTDYDTFQLVGPLPVEAVALQRRGG